MKGILEFNLPDEKEEFKLAQQGGEWKAVTKGLNIELRSLIKHGKKGVELTEPEKNLALKLRRFLFAFMNEYDLSLD